MENIEEETIIEEKQEKSELEKKIESMSTYYFDSDSDVYINRAETIDEQLKVLANIEEESLSDNQLIYINELLKDDLYYHFNSIHEYIDYLERNNIDLEQSDLIIEVCDKCHNDFYINYDYKESLFCRHNLIGESWIEELMHEEAVNNDRELETYNSCEFDLDEEERDRGLNRESFICSEHRGSRFENQAIKHKFICISCLDLTNYFNKCEYNKENLDNSVVVVCSDCEKELKNPANVEYYLKRKLEESE